MRLRQPRQAYSRDVAVDINGQIERADRENHKRGRDIEVGVGRLILTSPNGTRYSVTVDNAGNLTTTAL